MGKLSKSTDKEFSESRRYFIIADTWYRKYKKFGAAALGGIRLTKGMGKLSLATQFAFIDVKKELNELDEKIKDIDSKIDYIFEEHKRQAKIPKTTIYDQLGFDYRLKPVKPVKTIHRKVIKRKVSAKRRSARRRR